MSKSLGDRLRAQRERQHVTLSTIAAQTKIQIALLEGLERDDVSHWPGGIFRRAFVRAYARAIDLEPDVVVREFLERYPDPIDVPETGLPAAAGTEAPASRASSTRLWYYFDSARNASARLRGWIRRSLVSRDALPDDAPTPVMPPTRLPEPELSAVGQL